MSSRMLSADKEQVNAVLLALKDSVPKPTSGINITRLFVVDANSLHEFKIR